MPKHAKIIVKGLPARGNRNSYTYRAPIFFSHFHEMVEASECFVCLRDCRPGLLAIHKGHSRTGILPGLLIHSHLIHITTCVSELYNIVAIQGTQLCKGMSKPTAYGEDLLVPNP